MVVSPADPRTRAAPRRRFAVLRDDGGDALGPPDREPHRPGVAASPNSRRGRWTAAPGPGGEREVGRLAQPDREADPMIEEGTDHPLPTEINVAD